MIAFIRYVSFHLHYAYIMTSMWLKGILESKNFCLVRLGTSCGTIRCTIQFQRRTTFGIVGVIIMSYLRWSRWMVTVLIFISKVIRLSSCCWVHFLYLCQRFTHPCERHNHIIRCTLSLTVCMNKAVQLIILIRMRTPSSQLRLVEFRQRRWVGSIRDTEDIVHSIILVPVLLHSLIIRCKVHHLQTFTLFIPSIGFSILLLHFVRLLFSNGKRGVNTNSIEPIVAKLPCKKARSLYLH